MGDLGRSLLWWKQVFLVFYDTVGLAQPAYYRFMMISIAFLRSLVLTSVLSFIAPVLLIGCILAVLSLISQIPVIEAIAQVGAGQILEFLAVFGSGDVVEGLLVIGLTCGLVGALFDTYAFYRHQNLRDG
ncbi:hypothetical protein K9N68_08335 [Kovacikia minuta CCNUW1]|uniref:hypothetical protein n=1 Tax=Kovacikia minuta TaxID=2931930 RepID=UPI001CD00623|nr:hypothetical protein [Kovacikia minuta]UBF27893.1 hypothetical protein K9N68_08335 [Kovacikia minuta CCNUW1]